MKAGRRTLALLAAAAMVATGCGSDDESSSTEGGGGSGASAEPGNASKPAKGATVKVSATEFKFSPANPKVKPGKVTFDVSNDGQAPHALEVEAPSGEKETPVIQGGETAKLEVDLSKPGSYKLYCPVGDHEQQGMVGKVVVGG